MSLKLSDQIENSDVCSKCGGVCCIKCGCDYASSDFLDRTLNGFINALSIGDKSIVAMIDFETLGNGKVIVNPTLYIRARNKNRDIIDLVSMKTCCSMLTSDGCSYDYEHRPFGGKNLMLGDSGYRSCHPVVDPFEILNSWMPYQKQLAKIVKRYTGKSVEDKIREDVENLFYGFLIKDFRDVSALELLDLVGFIPLLKNAYPSEYQSALAKSKRLPLRSRMLNSKSQ